MNVEVIMGIILLIAAVLYVMNMYKAMFSKEKGYYRLARIAAAFIPALGVILGPLNFEKR